MIDIYNTLKKMMILLVDDNEWIRGSLRFHFNGHGCRLKAVETGEEALEVIKKNRYDIIIADYKLPGIDGLKFFQRVQELHIVALKILITAYGSERVFIEAAKLGVHECLDKPLTVNSIEESLRRLVGNGNHHGSRTDDPSGIEQEEILH